MMNEMQNNTVPSTIDANNIGLPVEEPCCFQQFYQKTLDRLLPYTRVRWLFAIILILICDIGIFIAGGWPLLLYALAIYHVNIFIAFLSLKFDAEGIDGGCLPTTCNPEVQPQFQRNLPEFKFWLASMNGTAIATICSFIKFFNLPVFWPIVLIFFLLLLCAVKKQRIVQMMKDQFFPFWNYRHSLLNRIITEHTTTTVSDEIASSTRNINLNESQQCSTRS